MLTIRLSGVMCYPWTRTSYGQPTGYIPVSISTRYENIKIKGDAKVENGVVV